MIYTPICKYCQLPFETKSAVQTICKADACRKQSQAEANAKHAAKKAQQRADQKARKPGLTVATISKPEAKTAAETEAFQPAAQVVSSIHHVAAPGLYLTVRASSISDRDMRRAMDRLAAGRTGEMHFGEGRR